MHREGHIGIGLMVYAPIAYVLIASDLMVLFGLGLVAMAAWSFLPDIDMQLPIRHRGPTHSLVAAAVAGVITAVVFAYFTSTGTFHANRISESNWVAILVLSLAGFGFGFLGVISHLVGDVLTPSGIRPFWPRSDRKLTLELVLAKDQAANQRLALAGAVVMTGAIVLAEL